MRGRVGDDGDDLARLRGGDVAAYDALFARHVDGARRVARSMLRDAAAAEDAVAEAFAQTYAAIQHGRGPVDGFDVYIRRSVRHQCLRTWRRQDRQRPAPEAAVATRLGPVSDGADERVDEEVLRSAFRDLPSKMRLVLWRTEVEGRSHAEVADQIHATPAAVAALAMRARRELARQYLHRHVTETAHLAADCAAAQADLAAVVRDAAGARRRNEVEDHLATCPECQDARQGLERVNARLRTAPLGVLLDAWGRAPLVGLLPRLGAVLSSAGTLVPAAGLVVALTVAVSAAEPAAAEPARDAGRQVMALEVDERAPGSESRRVTAGAEMSPSAPDQRGESASGPPNGRAATTATAATTASTTTVTTTRAGLPTGPLVDTAGVVRAMLPVDVPALVAPVSIVPITVGPPAALAPTIGALSAAGVGAAADATAIVEVATVVAAPAATVEIVAPPPVPAVVPRPPAGPVATILAAVPTVVPAPVTTLPDVIPDVISDVIQDVLPGLTGG